MFVNIHVCQAGDQCFNHITTLPLWGPHACLPLQASCTLGAGGAGDPLVCLSVRCFASRLRWYFNGKWNYVFCNRSTHAIFLWSWLFTCHNTLFIGHCPGQVSLEHFLFQQHNHCPIKVFQQKKKKSNHWFLVYHRIDCKHHVLNVSQILAPSTLVKEFLWSLHLRCT